MVDPTGVDPTDPSAPARSYATRMYWPVSQGTWLTGEGRCSCLEPACPRPGAHPLASEWWLDATRDPGLVRKWWTARPRAGIVAPTGFAFDVLDVPVVPGREAVRLLVGMGQRLGPVALTGDARLLIFTEVVARACAEPPLDVGRRYGVLDLFCHTEGSYVGLPPSAGVRWMNPPTPDGALPELDELIGTVAYVCASMRPGDRRRVAQREPAVSR